MANTKIDGVTKMNTESKTYSWRIQDFKLHGKRQGEYISSPKFAVGNIEWDLRLYPKYLITENYLSYVYTGLFLELFNNNGQSVINAVIDFSIFSLHGNLNKQQVVHTFDKGSNVGGIAKYINPSDLSKYLENGDLTIICTFRFGLDTVHLSLSNTSNPQLSLKYDNGDVHEQVDTNIKMLSEDYVKLLEYQRFCDVTFTASGKTVRAHKAILSARSPVFSALFTHDVKENKENTITIEDAQFDTLLEMLRFIYSGRVEKLDRLAYELFYLSDKYALVGLKKLCEGSLSNCITIHNAIDILVLSDLHSADVLKKKTLGFIKNHAATIVNTEKYKNLEKTNSALIAEILRAIVTI